MQSKSAMLRLTVLVILSVFYSSIRTLSAQENLSTQLLFRDGSDLILVDTVTGEERILAGVQVAERDRFEWSPKGKYILGFLSRGQGHFERCLYIYDVDSEIWLYEEPIACQIEAAEFSHNEEFVAFSTRTADEINGSLWIWDLAFGRSDQLVQTEDGNAVNAAGITDIHWSPTDSYITAIDYRWILGGTVNGLTVANRESGHIYGLSAGGGYYASYKPIWSPDDNWFLMTLQEEYVTSGSEPYTNHEGDLYLFRSDDGEAYRLTYTPAQYEFNPHWTDEGQIGYTVFQTLLLSVEDAINISAPNPETIIQPKEIVRDYRTTCMGLNSYYELRDSTFMVALCPPHPETSGAQDYLVIYQDEDTIYARELSEAVPSDSRNIIIGWRPVPSDGQSD